MDIFTQVEAFVQEESKPVIVVLGPTASGKTSLSICIAKAVPTIEIINADSRQLYTRLNIGTAKITTEEMQGVPHHLFGVVDPTEEVSVGWYKRKALEEINSLHSQGKVPMFVGGSMLYISALVDNFTLPIPIDVSVRKRVQADFDQHGAEYLHAYLQQHDPKEAERIHPHNTQHLLRAVEVHYQTGESKSEKLMHATADSPFSWLQLGVKRERSDLVERINQRTDAMFEAGWLEEVQELLDVGYTKNDPGMMSHGYRECIAYLESGSTDLESLKADIAQKTRAYAKRQMTWWKRDDRIEWVSPE